MAASVGFALTPLAAAWAWAHFFSPQKPGRDKNDTYECGLASKGDAWIHFRSEYYLYGIIFLVFDVETIFLFPWATIVRDLGYTGLYSIIFFIVILGLGLAYAWKKNVLKWN